MTSQPYTLYGAPGSGSVPVEAALTLLGQPYTVVDHQTWADAAAAEAMGRINPLRQVPALVLPSGELMTESAAILIWLGDRFPERSLAPLPGAAERSAFLRWMAYVSAAIYALYWVKDDPSRLATTESDEPIIKGKIEARIMECWRLMDPQVPGGRYLLGDQLTVLDLYVAVMSRWGIGRRRFYLECPRMADVVRRIDAEPRLQALWAERFPFEEGWER